MIRAGAQQVIGQVKRYDRSGRPYIKSRAVTGAAVGLPGGYGNHALAGSGRCAS